MVTTNHACIRLTWNSANPRPENIETVEALECDHEEADTRLILHAAHANSSEDSVSVIVSPDTDVALIGISHALSIKGIVYMAISEQSTPTKNCKIFNLTQTARALQEERAGLPKAIIALHALTGCDTNSRLKDISTSQWWDLLGKSPDDVELLAEFGSTQRTPLSGENIQQIESFIHHIYEENDGKRKKGSLAPPPTTKLYPHIRRAWYQTSIWRRAKDKKINPPCPTEHGWKEEKGHFVIESDEQVEQPKNFEQKIEKENPAESNNGI